MCELEQKFKKSIFYKRLGFFTILLATIPSSSYHSNKSFITLMIALIILGIGLFLISRFKCPYCKYTFDPRVRLSELKYCPKCGGELPNYKEL